MASRPSVFLYSTFIFLYGYLVTVYGQATVHVYCDDFGGISHSNGAGWTVDADRFSSGFWSTLITAVITDISSSTIIRATCIDGAHTGGFVGQVTYLGQQYYTTNPLSSGLWRVTSAQTGSTSSLTYETRSCCSEINSNAYFVWNGQNSDTITFDLHFSDIIPSPQPTSPPTPRPTAANPTPTPTTGIPTTSPPTTAAPTTAQPTTAAPTTAAPTTTTKFNEAEVRDYTTEAPNSDENEDEMDAPPSQDDQGSELSLGTEMYVVVSVAVFVLCCLSFICICLLYKYTKQRKEMMTEPEEIHRLPSTEVIQEAVAYSYNAGESAQKEPQPVMQSNAVAQVNMSVHLNRIDSASVDHDKTDTEDALCDNAEGENDQQDGELRMDSMVTRGGSAIVEMKKDCTDCGLKKDGKVFDEDGLFYCWECWKAYQ
eukprot:582914_1